MSQPELPRYAAPPGLRERVQAAVRAEPARRRPSWRPSVRQTGIAAAAVVVLAVSGWLIGQRRSADTELAAVFDAHLRSLAPGHLADVAFTDQHTVKPWFAGKLNFSPPVVDPAAEGFPLVGGRVDVVNGRSVAALVYSRRNHLINVFVRPLERGEPSAGRDGEQRGYHVAGWIRGGMRFWAVSDLNPQELAQFRELLRAR